MRSRLLILVVAVVLGLAAAFAAGSYLDSARRQVEAGTEPVQILVAAKPIAPGITAEQALKDGAVVKREVARQYVADEAVSSFATIDGKVSAVDLSTGEQVTTGDFRYSGDAGASFSVPEGLLAVSIKDDPVVGVSRMVKPGDYVAVVATFELQPGQMATAVTRIVIPKARVLAVDQNLTASSVEQSSDTKSEQGTLISSSGSDTALEVNTVTLAVAPADVEKVAFAEDEGQMRLALISKSGEQPAGTKGITIGDLVNKDAFKWEK